MAKEVEATGTAKQWRLLVGAKINKWQYISIHYMWNSEEDHDWGRLVEEMQADRASIELYLIAELDSDIISFIEKNMSRQGRRAVIITPDELGNHLLREQQYWLYFLNDDYGSFEVIEPVLGETELTRGIPPPQIQLYSTKSIYEYDRVLHQKVKDLQDKDYRYLFYFPQSIESLRAQESPS